MPQPATVPPAIDPLRSERREAGSVRCPFQGENVLMLLRHGDVRAAAADPVRFSSDAPCRVPIPSEESVRSVRQLPLEIDPPQHTAYRAISEPFFLRAKKKEVIASVAGMIDRSVERRTDGDPFDAVGELAIEIQSKALTYLLDVPESEADRWIRWGIHVFKASGGGFKSKNVLDVYLEEQFDRGEREGGNDFFATLVRSTIDGRRLTREECMGYGNIAFAGGRDTIIHSLTSILHHFAVHPESLEYLRDDPRRITLAAEEFFRVFMPLTHIGRVATTHEPIDGERVDAGDRVSLCWSAANFDEQVFDKPHDIRLDRRPNPHVSFGYRTHLCQGAPHARLVVRSFLSSLCQKVQRIELLDAQPLIEHEAVFDRQVGHERLRLRFVHG